MGKTLLEATVKQTKKRRHPSKFYVYVLEVTWSEGTATTIYRRYSDFFEFQCGLLERFPEEAGAKDPAARIIPFLPGKKLLGRSQVRSVAEKRRDKLNDYCKALVRLPTTISDDEFVHNFFEVWLEDLKDPSKAGREKTAKLTSSGEVDDISGPIVLERYVAVADYEKQKKNECCLTAGQMVEVVDKNQNGWWFVSLDNFNEGWVPATYLDPLYGTEEAQVEVFAPGQEQYITSSGYHAQNPDELSFEKGVIVDVIVKGVDGWWTIRYKEREGLAPAAYLNRYTSPHSSGAAPAQLVESVRDAVRQASGTKQSWTPSARIDIQEPIYAPTPRKKSVQRKIQRLEPSTPTTTTDEPCPVYEVIGEPEEEVYMTIADFKSANTGDGLSFSTGCAVSVVTKNASGWWYVEMGEREGWVPSSYLERKPATPTPAPSIKHPAKSSPVHRRQPPLVNKNSAIRRSTSEETIGNPSRAQPHRVISPPGKSLQTSQSKPTVSKHVPVTRSASSEDRVRNKSHLPPRAQQTDSSLNLPSSQHTRTHSAGNQATTASTRSGPREKGEASRGGSMAAVSELAIVLQKKQSAAAVSSSGSRVGTSTRKIESPRLSAKNPSPSTARRLELTRKQAPELSNRKTGSVAKTPSPSTSKRLDLSKKQPPERPKPYSASKRVPPKRPEPPKISNTTKNSKTAPPRPSTSPGQKRKTTAATSSFMVMSDYRGGEGRPALRKGQCVEVLEKNSDGWWYVKAGSEEGWAPATFLEEGKPKPERPAGAPPNPSLASGSNRPSPSSRPVPKPRRSNTQASHNTNTYRAAASYEVPPYEDSGINLVEGKTYQVLDKADGWWFVSDGKNEGWAPPSYLDPV